MPRFAGLPLTFQLSSFPRSVYGFLLSFFCQYSVFPFFAWFVGFAFVFLCSPRIFLGPCEDVRCVRNYARPIMTSRSVWDGREIDGIRSKSRDEKCCYCGKIRTTCDGLHEPRLRLSRVYSTLFKVHLSLVSSGP